MEIITNKKELFKKIGEWTTVLISSNYNLGSNQIELSYKNEKILYKNNNIKHVAYIALQCNAINHKQYEHVLFN